MSQQECYDGVLLGILQNEGEIENFLDVFFSFLYRRTDFFRHLIFPKDKYGFRAGVAKQVVLNAFKKYETLAADKNLKLEEAYARHLREEQANMAQEVEVSHVIREEIVEESRPATTPSNNNSSTHDNTTTAHDNTTTTHDNTTTTHNNTTTTHDTSASSMRPPSSSRSVPNAEENMEDNHGTTQTTVITSAATTTTTTTSAAATTSTASTTTTDCKSGREKESKKGKSADDSDDDPELARLQKMFQSNPESYNGAVRDNYCWSQSIGDLDVRVKMPKFIKKGKEVKVEIDKKRLKVAYKSTPANQEVVVVDGDLCWEIQKEESVWSLVPGEHVYVNIEKTQERWWDALLEGEPKISVRKIDPSRPITDLGDEEQVKVQEMMFNERQKRLGLPQSHEQKTHELLKKAWDAEGSPFKGQPFDPSKLNISTGGGSY